MGHVKKILHAKGNMVYSVGPDATVYSAIELMCEKNIGGLLILENEKLLGIFTERDYARKLILKGKSSKEAKIKELMTSDVITVTPHTNIDECMATMSAKRIRHLPVVEDGKVVGMISIGDVVKHVIEEQKDIIEHLESYITH
jgi:CBS domain-containing protein